MTTPLKVTIPNTFSPQEGITLITNFPVSLENLIGALDLTDSGGVHMESIVTPVRTENGSMSETSYTIMPKNQTFFYQTNYILKVRTSLKPKYGTEPLLTESITALTTSNFARVEPYQNIYDNSGILIDTKSWSYPA